MGIRYSCDGAQYEIAAAREQCRYVLQHDSDCWSSLVLFQMFTNVNVSYHVSLHRQFAMQHIG